jgi:hypothetical protein
VCVPGERGVRLDPDEQWLLFVSAVLQKGHVTACRGSLAAGSVCMQTASATAPTCVPIAEACAHHDRGTTPIVVTTSDLTREAISIAIKDGKGRTVASREGVLYESGLRRSTLCLGARAGDFTTTNGPEIEALTFFLAPLGS